MNLRRLHILFIGAVFAGQFAFAEIAVAPARPVIERVAFKAVISLRPEMRPKDITLKTEGPAVTKTASNAGLGR